MDLDIKVKLIIVGLLIISLAAVYLIFSQKTNQQTNNIVENQPVVQTTPAPAPSSVTTYRQSPQIVGKNSTANQNLPKTAFPSYFLGVFALSAAISGFFLRKFPQ